MRQWVMAISRETRKVDSDFIVIPQNSSPLLTISGQTDGKPARAFIAAIDGLGQESLCFGTDGYGIPRSEKSREEIAERLGLAREYTLSVLSIDYCSRAGQMVFAAQYNDENGFLGFSAPNFELTQIPDMTARSNSRDIMRLSEAENFLVLLNPAQYTDKQDYISALSQTDYDVLVIDADFDGKTVLDVRRHKPAEKQSQRGNTAGDGIFKHWRGRRVPELLAGKLERESAGVATA